MKVARAEDLSAPAEVKAAVADFIQRLRAATDAAGDVVVFGSVARGEYSADSDVDILVRWDGDELAASRLLAELATDILLETGIDISAFAVNREHHAAWEAMNTRFYQTVQTEGLVVG